MKTIKAVLAALLIGLVAGCGTDKDLRVKSVNDAREAVVRIETKREDTRVTLAKEEAARVKGAADACMTGNDPIKTAMCFLGMAAIAKGGTAVAEAPAAAVSVPVLQPEKSALREGVEVLATVVSPLMPLLQTGLQVYAQIEGQKTLADTQNRAAEFNFRTESARVDGTARMFASLADVAGKGVVVNGDANLGNGILARIGGDGVVGSGTYRRTNCVATTQAGTLPPPNTSGTATAPIVVQPTPAPGGALTLGC